MLGVDRIRQCDADATQRIARGIEHLAAERHHATERAARDAVGDVHRRAGRTLQADGVPGGIVGIGGRNDR